MKKLLFSMFFICLVKSSFAQWTNHQNAEFIIGQPDFTTYTSGTANNKFSVPKKAAIDFTNNKMYVVDYANHRVLRFAYPITGDNPTAERVFGTTGTYGTATQYQFCYPEGVAVYDGALWVCDPQNMRIVKFSNAHLVSSDSPNADCVLGQTDYTSRSSGCSQSKFYFPGNIFIDSGGNLWVVDENNHRVLKFNDVNNKSIGANADMVLGQTDFDTKTSGTSDSKFNDPSGVVVSGTTVWISDTYNHRVLRFDNPTSNGASAAAVLGQNDFNSNTSGYSANKFDQPYDVTIDLSGRLYVSDLNNARVMIYNDAASKSNGADADNVLGQSDLSSLSTTNGGQNNFNYYVYMGATREVDGVTVDPINNKLLVVDGGNNRVLQFAASSTLPVELTSFTASTSSSSVTLNWQTATEVNNYGFNVECRMNNEEWETIGFVEGNGNSNSLKEYSFTDKDVTEGKYCYRLKQINTDGSFSYSKEAEVNIESLPTEFALYQNYPNPFNPSTQISFELPQQSNTTLIVYNMLGQEVATLVNQKMEAGKYDVKFDGSKLSSGVYIYKLQSGSFVQTKEFVLLK